MKLTEVILSDCKYELQSEEVGLDDSSLSLSCLYT